MRDQTAQTLAGEEASPDFKARQALTRALVPARDPTLRQATLRSVAKVTLADVRAYDDAVFRPDETTIVVAGDVTPAAAKATVERWFGGWTARGPKPVLTLPMIPANVASSAFVPATGRVQSDVTLAETVDVPRSSHDAYAIQLGNAILGGGFYATRLYHDLRERSGLVYSVGVNLRTGKTPGAISKMRIRQRLGECGESARDRRRCRSACDGDE